MSPDNTLLLLKTPEAKGKLLTNYSVSQFAHLLFVIGISERAAALTIARQIDPKGGETFVFESLSNGR